MIGVEECAEIRRLYFVEKRSKRAIWRLTGAHRDTMTSTLVYEVISAPYLGRTRAPGLEILARSGHLAVARDHTEVHFYTSQTTEVVELTPPTRVSFRDLCGPAPHALEEFVLEQIDAGTELRYSGELGVDFFTMGRIAGRRWVRRLCVRVASADIDEIRGRAETTAARPPAGGSSRPIRKPDGSGAP